MINRHEISIPAIFLLAFLSFSLMAQLPVGTIKPQPQPIRKPVYLVNPSSWISESYTQLNELYLNRDELILIQ